MARVKKDATTSCKVASIDDRKTEIQRLQEDINRLTLQLAFVMKENNFLRRQANQPEAGPLIPSFVQKDTVEKIEDADWYYRAIDNQGVPVVMDKKTGKWLRLSRAIYTRHFGKIPKGYMVVPVDGNNRNFEPSNWAALPKQDFLKQTGWSFESNPDGSSQSCEIVNIETGEVRIRDE